MRASRLLTILMHLQARGRATAQELADACEVSLRTIYRDVDALSEAGVPVYSERGQDGGYRLLDGYKTRLNGLSQKEAEALFLSGAPDAAAELGLGAVLAAAQLKLLAAMPADVRASAEKMRARFHLDAAAWLSDAERPPHLQAITGAVWRQTLLRIRYRSWKREVERTLAPLGLVLKGGAWYMVASSDGGEPRIYRVGHILQLTTLEKSFAPPRDFDLAAFWNASQQRFAETLYPERATIRFSPHGLRMMQMLGPAAVKAAQDSTAKPDKSGWRELSVPIESVRHAAVEVMRLGAEAEVIAPPELRALVIAKTEALQKLYAQRRRRV